MNINKQLAIVVLAIAFISQACSPRVKSRLASDTYQQLSPDAEIYVVHNYSDLPPGSEYLGGLKTQDAGLSVKSCGYDQIISDAMAEARRKGANVLAITKVKQPNLWTPCYRVKANLYYNENSSFLAKLEENLEATNESTLPADADYAVVHFYRPRYFPGSAIGYDIKDDKGNVLGRVKNGSAFQYKTTTFGETVFYAKNGKEQVTIDLQPGQEYFLRCSVAAGVPLAKPDMYVMDNNIAAKELSEM